LAAEADRAAEPTGSPAQPAAVRKAEASRSRILDSAAFVFHQKGYALTRLSDIANHARLRPGSIYYHFDSREAIVAEVLRIANERTARAVQGRIDRLPANSDVEARIAAAIEGQFAIVLSGDHYASAHMRIFDQTPTTVREHYLRVLDANAQVWRDLFEEARDQGIIRPDLDLSVVRLLLLGMINWAIEWYKPDRLGVEDVTRHAILLFMEGVRKRISPE
jgi:AcrR family transcriptional regulator